MSRYTSVTGQDLEAMLGAIGAGSLDDLFADIPDSVRLGRAIDLPEGRSEQDVNDHLSAAEGMRSKKYRHSSTL